MVIANDFTASEIADGRTIPMFIIMGWGCCNYLYIHTYTITNNDDTLITQVDILERRRHSKDTKKYRLVFRV